MRLALLTALVLLSRAPSSAVAAEVIERKDVRQFYRTLGLQPEDRFTWPDRFAKHIRNRLGTAICTINPRMPRPLMDPLTLGLYEFTRSLYPKN